MDRSGDPLSGSYMHLTAAPRFLLAPVAVSLAGGSREAARRPRRSKEYLCELQRGRPLYNRRVFLLDKMRVICEHYGTCVRESTGQTVRRIPATSGKNARKSPGCGKALGKTEYLDTAEGVGGNGKLIPAVGSVKGWPCDEFAKTGELDIEGVTRKGDVRLQGDLPFHVEIEQPGTVLHQQPVLRLMDGIRAEVEAALAAFRPLL